MDIDLLVLMLPVLIIVSGLTYNCTRDDEVKRSICKNSKSVPEFQACMNAGDK